MSGALAGKRILIVEDEYFVAADLRRTLKKEGAEIVGPVGDLDGGLDLAAEPVDAAVLDVNLGEASAYLIAKRLRSRGVPYMFLTGYDGWSLPPDYQDDPRLAKPFAMQSMLAMVADLISSERRTA